MEVILHVELVPLQPDDVEAYIEALRIITEIMQEMLVASEACSSIQE
jgi:hypothetical protein